MKTKSQISQEDFENLLNCFSANREQAGEKYEQIRRGLLRFYRFRGCDEPENLVDETINRVAKKLSAASFDNQLQITSYFYSFASKIYLEDLKSKPKKNSLTDLNRELPAEDTFLTDEEKERKFKCLEKCLAELGAQDGRLIVEYYSREKNDKLKFRALLAQRLKVKLPALHTRVFRLRSVLRDCIENCLK